MSIRIATIALSILASARAAGHNEAEFRAMGLAYLALFIAVDPTFPKREFVAACREAWEMSGEVGQPATVRPIDPNAN